MKLGFQKLTDKLQYTILIFYNPGKEIVILAGYSHMAIASAMKELRILRDDLSRLQGRKYLATSHSDLEVQPLTSRTSMLNSSSTHHSCSCDASRVFSIKPKENRKLVRLWFHSILPALPQILDQPLGGTYTASLVRRGQIDISAQPCIQIESPRIPSAIAQSIIKDSLNLILNKEGHPPVDIRFAQGKVSKLNGSEEQDDDNAAVQRLRFNHVRPYSKPRMGSSLGLLCSKRIFATLGGFVLLDGIKYMLTSEHFVKESQKPTNNDSKDEDFETLTSPSRYDLEEMENCLKQTKRDADFEINTLTQRRFGNNDISEATLNDPNELTPEIREARRKGYNATNLLLQITRQPTDYAIGTAFKHSNEPRTTVMPKPLAELLHLETDTLTHSMDWSLCKVNDQSCENRHKYRSNQEAMADDYIEEREHAYQPGEICHETCDPESDVAVYYVGRGSDHRSGAVNIPMLVSIESSTTYEWAIISSDGQHVPYPDVAGDSGAWVIRKNGNKVMGQIILHGNGQVLFTPINVLLADLQDHCGTEASLPPRSTDSGRLAIGTPARQLCSIPREPRTFTYKFLSKSPMASASRPEVSLSGIGIPQTESLDFSGRSASSHDVDDSQCSLLNLAKSQESSLITAGSLEKSPEKVCTDDQNTQAGAEELPVDSPRSTLSEPTGSWNPYLQLELAEPGKKLTGPLAPDASKPGPHIPSHEMSTARARTWPVELKRRAVRREGVFGASRHTKSGDYDAALKIFSSLGMYAFHPDDYY